MEDTGGGWAESAGLQMGFLGGGNGSRTDAMSTCQEERWRDGDRERERKRERENPREKACRL